MGCAPQCRAVLGQKSLSDSLELKSQATVSQLTWVLGTELWAVCALNCWIISAASLLCSWSTKRKVKSIQVISWIFSSLLSTCILLKCQKVSCYQNTQILSEWQHMLPVNFALSWQTMEFWGSILHANSYIPMDLVHLNKAPCNWKLNKDINNKPICFKFTKFWLDEFEKSDLFFHYSLWDHTICSNKFILYLWSLQTLC